jgi:hypothetical protein
MFVGFPTLKHATYCIVAHVKSMDHSVVKPFVNHFPESIKQVEKVKEGFTYTLTLRVGSTVLSSR